MGGLTFKSSRIEVQCKAVPGHGLGRDVLDPSAGHPILSLFHSFGTGSKPHNLSMWATGAEPPSLRSFAFGGFGVFPSTSIGSCRGCEAFLESASIQFQRPRTLEPNYYTIQATMARWLGLYALRFLANAPSTRIFS
jgi:hypothetical protein